MEEKTQRAKIGKTFFIIGALNNYRSLFGNRQSKLNLIVLLAPVIALVVGDWYNEVDR